MCYSQAELTASWKQWDKVHLAHLVVPKPKPRKAWNAHIKKSWERWDAIHLAHLQEPYLHQQVLNSVWQERPAVVVVGSGQKEHWKQLDFFYDFASEMPYQTYHQQQKREDEAERNYVVGLAKGWFVKHE